MLAFVADASQAQDGGLPDVLLFDFRDGQVELVAKPCADRSHKLALAFQRVVLGELELEATGAEDHRPCPILNGTPGSGVICCYTPFWRAIGRCKGPGGPRGLQNRCAAVRAVAGGFDSHAPPPHRFPVDHAWEFTCEQLCEVACELP